MTAYPAKCLSLKILCNTDLRADTEGPKPYKRETLSICMTYRLGKYVIFSDSLMRLMTCKASKFGWQNLPLYSAKTIWGKPYKVDRDWLTERDSYRRDGLWAIRHSFLKFFVRLSLESNSRFHPGPLILIVPKKWYTSFLKISPGEREWEVVGS